MASINVCKDLKDVLQKMQNVLSVCSKLKIVLRVMFRSSHANMSSIENVFLAGLSIIPHVQCAGEIFSKKNKLEKIQADNSSYKSDKLGRLEKMSFRDRGEVSCPKFKKQDKDKNGLKSQDNTHKDKDSTLKGKVQCHKDRFQCHQDNSSFQIDQ